MCYRSGALPQALRAFRDGFAVRVASQRIPIIRIVRTIWHAVRIERHYQEMSALGLVHSGYDEWVLWAMRRGMC